jgi:hypothetical protein
MHVSSKVRFRQFPWPRVMCCVGQPTHRSVNTGKTRLCIELRNQFFSRPTLLCQGEGNRRERRVRRRLHGVQDQMHGQKTILAEAGRPQKHSTRWRLNAKLGWIIADATRLVRMDASAGVWVDEFRSGRNCGVPGFIFWFLTKTLSHGVAAEAATRIVRVIHVSSSPSRNPTSIDCVLITPCLCGSVRNHFFGRT